jgi:hypothetical protein
MTEQEYIYTRDLSNVMVMRRCLDDLNPGHSVMTEKERAQVWKILKRWQEELHEKITGEKV